MTEEHTSSNSTTEKFDESVNKTTAINGDNMIKAVIGLVDLIKDGLVGEIKKSEGETPKQPEVPYDVSGSLLEKVGDALLTTTESEPDKDHKSALIGDIFMNIGEAVKSKENKKEAAMSAIDNVCELIKNEPSTTNQHDRHMYGQMLKDVGSKLKQGEENIGEILITAFFDMMKQQLDSSLKDKEATNSTN